MIKIETLINHPESIPELTKLWYDLLGRRFFPEIGLEKIEHWYSEWLNDSIPLAYVVFDDSVPVASCSLQWNDGIRPDLFPWFGDLIVSPNYQNLGIGKLLIEFSMKEAKKMGFLKLYLFMFEYQLVNYYSRFGWYECSRERHLDNEVIVLCVDL